MLFMIILSLFVCWIICYARKSNEKQENFEGKIVVVREAAASNDNLEEEQSETHQYYEIV